MGSDAQLANVSQNELVFLLVTMVGQYMNLNSR